MDPITDKISIGTATNILTDIFKGAGKLFINTSKAHDFLGIAAKKYAEKFIERHNRIKIIGQTEPTPLTNIYVTVNVLKKITSWQRFTPADLDAWEKEYRKRGSFGEIKDQSVDGLELAGDKSHLMLLGQPGGGKTTFLKHIGIQTLQGKLKQRTIPVFVSLKDLADSGQTLYEYLTLEFEICGLPDAGLFIEKQLKDGKLYLLLDGLDEVGKGKADDVCKNINDFCDKHSQNKFIISCRTAAYNQNFPKFTDVELSDFSDPQIDNFVRNWFHDNETKARACTEKLHSGENKPILELAKRPLLLALLCLAYNETMDFPPNRAELYKDAIGALLTKWDTTRNIKRDEIYRHLSTQRKEEMLSRIA